MQKLPHRYHVTASGAAQGPVQVAAETLPTLQTLPPPEFGGPGGHWSPESLLLAAVGDCYLLSFRAIARLSQQGWDALTCEVEGLLERDGEGTTRFTEITLRPLLTLPAGSDEGKARALLAKAKQACLVSNSLNARIQLEPQLQFAQAA